MQKINKTALLIAVVVASLAATEARAGGLYRLIYGQTTPIIGEAVEALTNSLGFPTAVDSVDLIGFQGGPLYRRAIQEDNTAGPRTGSLMEGFLEPPQDGNYSFWVAGQDAEEFWLSPDETAAKARLLIANPVATSDQNWSTWDSQKAANVPLLKGKKYYFKLLQKTYYGSGSLALGWQLPDGTLERPMWAFYAQPYTNAAVAPAIAFTDPVVALPSPTNSDTHVSATIVENDKIVFQITMNASSQINTYQWNDNGTAIPGATMSYYVTRARLAQHGHAFTCVVNGSIISSPMTLTLTADTAPLGIVSTSTKGNPQQVIVQFSKPVSSASATEKTHYTLNHGATVSGATMRGEDTVVLATSTLALGNTYTLTVNNVSDTSATPITIAPNTTSVFVLVDGVVQVNMWYMQPNGGNLAALNTSATAVLGTPPTNSFSTTSLETPFWANGEFLFGQVCGYLTPLTNGTYEFAMAANDTGALYLSTDANPANKVLLVSCDNGQNHLRAYQSNPLSAPVSLVGGQRYYIEALWRESHHDDSSSGINVAWQEAGSGTIVNGGPAIPGQFLSGYKTPGSVVVTQPLPATTNVVEDQSLTLSIGVDGVDGTPDYTYQWQKNGTPITGATDVTYVTPPLALADQGATFTLIVKNSFSTASTAITVGTVTPDTTAPVLLGAGSLHNPLVTVTFSKPVTPATALNLANYTLKDPTDSPVALSNPVLSPDGTQVTLTAAALTTFAPYNLSVQNVRDISAAGNLMAPASTDFAPIDLVARNVQPFEQVVQNRLQPWSMGYVGRSLNLNGYGNEVGWYGNEQGVVACMTVTNDFDFCVQINAFSYPGDHNNSSGGRVGLIAREYDMTASDGKMLLAWANIHYMGDLFLDMRDASDGDASHAQFNTDPSSDYPDQWIRLNRVGNVFTAYSCRDGENWVTFGGEDTDNDAGRWTAGGMPSVLKLGLAECTLSLVSRSAISIGYFGPSIVPIVITKQPPAKMAVVANQPFTVKVIAAGFPIHYQWTLGGTDIPGATSATYTVPSASAADIGTYTVRLSNVYQSDVTSTSCVVTLATQPTGLAIHLNGTVPVVTWTSGVLQQAGEVTGTWGDVSSATSPYSVPAGSAHKFYRLRNSN